MLLSCAAAKDDEPITCSKSERTGIYLLTYTVLSGDCGDVPDELGRFKDGIAESTGDGAECVFEAKSWKNENCTLESRSVCLDGDRKVTWDWTTEQVEDDGSSFAGTASAKATTTAGQALCSGTYRVRATRQ